jgi:hypothetical protein
MTPSAIGVGYPPEFGPAGESPPLVTAPTIVSSSVFHVRTDRPDLRPDLLDSPELLQGVLNVSRPGIDEFRRLVYSQRWRRDDPVMQLPPGVSQERQFSVKTGISETHSRELARWLGLRAGQFVSLSRELSSQFGVQLKVSQEMTRTDTLTLRNDSLSRYRRYAKWTLVHQLAVFDLAFDLRNPVELSPEQILRGETTRVPEHLLSDIEILDASAVSFTSVDVDPGVAT